ncbi:hypothetical protein RF657_19450, partial [Yersinia rochesterensis]|nr:hypothetical protein [Yersinia rochesterensis]
VTWWTGPEPTLTGELESFHDHETGSHYLPLISLSTTSYAALSREKFIFKVTNFLCTRRQSIAREGETAALIYDMVTTPQLNSPEIRKLILSEVSDFCAGFGHPGEPESPEDIQQALMSRVELVFNNRG